MDTALVIAGFFIGVIFGYSFVYTLNRDRDKRVEAFENAIKEMLINSDKKKKIKKPKTKPKVKPTIIREKNKQ